jgi:hypothetical protein
VLLLDAWFLLRLRAENVSKFDRPDHGLPSEMGDEDTKRDGRKARCKLTPGS